MSLTKIKSVDAHSPAQRAGVRPGETLTHINGRPIVDVLDYKYYAYDPELGLQLRSEAGERTVELAKIAGFLHDIGNLVNRVDHSQSGAVMAFRILDKMGMEPADVAAVITAIGHHDDPTAFPVNPVAAALILADKTDVRRSRVRNKEHQSFDIHDRVNYAAERSELTLDPERRTLTLSLGINTEFCAVMDYFEIFLERMLLCRRAAEFLELTFKLDINGLSLL